MVQILLPLIQIGAKLFQETFPHLYLKQIQQIQVLLHGTLWQQFVINEGSAGFHYDGSDYGYSMLIVLGDFIGGEFVSPTLGASFVTQPGSILFFNSHENLHAVSKTIGNRYSIVAYLHTGCKNKPLGQQQEGYQPSPISEEMKQFLTIQ